MRAATGTDSAAWLVGAAGATAVAAWCLIGDQSEPDGYMRIVPTIVITRSVELVVGTAAALIALVAGRTALRGIPARAWWPVGGAVVAAAVIVGFGGRVVSSATYGANIGGGLVVLAGPPAAAAPLTSGVRRLRRLQRPDHPA